MNTIPIVFAFDKRFMNPAVVCLVSLLENANAETFYDVFILHSSENEFKGSCIDLLPNRFGRCRINYINVGDSFSNAYEVRGITKATYYRLLIPSLIPEYDKVIYSDVDVIFREDLTQYYNMDLEDNWVAGVRMPFSLFPYYANYYKSLNLVPDDIICAGSIILNSKALRANNVVDLFLDLSKNNYEFQDMDVLNIVCKDRIKFLPMSFGMTVFHSDSISNNRDFVLNIWGDDEIQHSIKKGTVHYNGQKPWVDICPNFDVWWEYYRKSPVFDYSWYSSFWKSKMDILDKLSLWKRIKVLCRFFVFGQKS